MNPIQLLMMQVFGQNNNQNWMDGYTSINNNNNFINNNNQIPFNNNSQVFRMNFVFKTSSGNRFNVLFDPEKTVEDLILTFFRRVDKEELFKKGGISFVHNAAEIPYNIKIKVKDYFRGQMNPTLLVLDVNNLIGAK